MIKSHVQWLVAIPFLSMSFLLGGCRAKPVVTRVPAVNPREILAQGDSVFVKSHLYGWRQAETFYRRAYDLQPSAEIKDKLLLTRFLILTREVDEDILDPDMERALGDICSGSLNARQKTLCDMAALYKAGTGMQPVQKKEPPDPALFDLETSPLDAYLYSLCVQTYGLKETNEAAAARAEKFKDSPLFVYLYLGKKTAQKAEQLEKAFPDFAELFDFMGGEQFQRTRYTAARAYFKKAVDLIPDYTRSWNGLGNICLFALEDNDKALEYYQTSLKWNPGNTAALFGMGVIFHNLGRYADSNDQLDKLLHGDLARGGRTSEEAVRYYQGEANYYKAYNYHLLGNPEGARKFVEIAREFVPRSDNVNYLSGLLYYRSRQLRSAKDDFMRVLQSGSTNCDAQYYLGRIYRESKEELDEKPPEQTSGVKIPERLAEYLKQVPLPKEPKEKRSLDYLLAACSCMDANVRNMEGKIKSVPSMDLDETEKTLLQVRLKNHLQDYRRSSGSLIDGMLELASGTEMETRDTYLSLMKEIRERMLQAVEPPALPSPGRR
ncbi:MAG TPA: tetratricopeptide repeat protein [Acidobacteriota bacterium]|nr:tetratricopeptide repeat protein [Acidobacteriota bacterium]